MRYWELEFSGSDVLEIPHKLNLLSVSLLICHVFWFFWRETKTDFIFSENTFLCFLCPHCTIKSVCSSVKILTSPMHQIPKMYGHLFRSEYFLLDCENKVDKVTMNIGWDNDADAK